MLRAYKYRLYPNNQQKEYFARVFGCSRFIYNKMLSDKIEHYKQTGKMLNNTPAQYKKEYEWLKEIDSLALANAQLNLERAYKNFFRNVSTGFPKFKSKKANCFSYTTNNQNGTVFIEGNYIKLPKLKSKVKIVKHREFQGQIKSCTISQTVSGKYFISILVETQVEKSKETSKKIGIDLGLKEFAVCSNSERYANPKCLRKSEKKIKKLQKDMARKKKGSKNRNKARIKLAKAYEKIYNQRKDFLHKLSTHIIRENQTIVIEDLRVNNMLKNRKLAKAISDTSWARFRFMLEYKANWYGRSLVVAPSNYASSQLCSGCGNKSSQTKDLSVRTYICQECGLIIDRDYNASLNLLKLAI